MLTKYRDNLRVKGDKIYSYNTLVAEIHGPELWALGWWSQTTSKHINYVAKEYGLKKIDKGKEIKEPEKEKTNDFKALNMVMAMGQLFGKTQKERNDWDIRMLKAGLENKGLIMPEDWDTLPEKEKTKRLKKIKEVMTD